MLRRQDHHSTPHRYHYSHVIAITMLLLAFVNCVTSRSVVLDNFTAVDRSEVPAKYIFEIDEVAEESSEIDKNIYKSQGYTNRSLMFNMPIAVAVLAALVFLVCCFCCLRCAISYDEIKRSGFYGGLQQKKSKMTEIVRKLQLQPDPIISKK